MAAHVVVGVARGAAVLFPASTSTTTAVTVAVARRRTCCCAVAASSSAPLRSINSSSSSNRSALLRLQQQQQKQRRSIRRARRQLHHLQFQRIYGAPTAGLASAAVGRRRTRTRQSLRTLSSSFGGSGGNNNINDNNGSAAPTGTANSSSMSSADTTTTPTPTVAASDDDANDDDGSDSDTPGGINNKDAGAGAATAKKEEEEVPSFKVAKLTYETGDLERVTLRTSELLKSTSIYARDLISLNLTSRMERGRRTRRSTVVSEINPRGGDMIILSFGNIRAVVGLEYVFLFDAHNPAVKEFAREVSALYKSRSRSGIAAGSGGEKGNTTSAPTALGWTMEHHDLENEPYELVFLEAVLKDTVESFARRLRLLEPVVNSFVDKVSNELLTDDDYTSLVPLKNAIQSFEMKVRKSLDCLTELLNDDEEMLALLLTEQAEAQRTGKQVDFSRHEYVELLIGVYARQINNILMEIQFLLKRLQSKQEFVGLAMNAYRNRMVRMNVNVGIAALSFGFGTTTAGFFGMNLVSGFENTQNAFATVVALSGVGGMLIAIGCLNYVSGSALKERASRRLEENETLSSALSDMSALDFTIKTIEKQGVALDKAQFRSVLAKARHTKHVSDKEVDLLFDILDKVKDGILRSDDFKPAPGQDN